MSLAVTNLIALYMSVERQGHAVRLVSQCLVSDSANLIKQFLANNNRLDVGNV